MPQDYRDLISCYFGNDDKTADGDIIQTSSIAAMTQNHQSASPQRDLEVPSIQQSQSELSSTSPPLIYRIKQYQPQTIMQRFSYMLIRPPRFMYNEQLLHPPENYSARYKIEEHLIPFKLTLYRTEPMHYIILYLHGNSSSRFEGYMHLRQLPEGVGLACFDFNGCGMRFESDYITLGAKESQEVDVAARYLKQREKVKIVGWGRSMGSVSLLLSNEIDIMVADSPFYSLSDLCKESTYKFIPRPLCCFFYCLYPCVFKCVQSDVQERAGFSIKELEIAKKIAANPKNKQRCLFIMAGTQDNMIHFSHSQKIFEAFSGKKKLQLFEGSHNSNRPEDVLDKCFHFIEECVGIVQKPETQKQPKKNNIKLKPVNHINISSVDESNKKNGEENKLASGRAGPKNPSQQRLQKIKKQSIASLDFKNNNMKTQRSKVQQKQSLESVKKIPVFSEEQASTHGMLNSKQTTTISGIGSIVTEVSSEAKKNKTQSTLKNKDVNNCQGELQGQNRQNQNSNKVNQIHVQVCSPNRDKQKQKQIQKQQKDTSKVLIQQ